MAAGERWVCLDVGETLIDETRIWSIWADELRVPRLTLLAALGAVIERGGEHRDVFPIFGAEDWPLRVASVEATYGGFTAEDLYPDALPALDGLRSAGYRVAIIANQPASRTQQLAAIDVHAEVVAMSEEMDVAKPDPAFFDRVLDLVDAEPRAVAYVGDRVDNDVLPAIAAGMRAVWIRRGPWGVIQRLPAGTTPSLTVGTLDELVQRIDDAWVETDPVVGGP